MSRKGKRDSKAMVFVTVVIIPVILFIIMYLFFAGWSGVSIASTDNNIAFIEEHINSRGVLVDYQDEIGVKSIDDIKLFVKEDTVTIHFGRIVMTWTIADFCSEETGEKLRRIGITRYRDKETGRLRVFWGEEEIERWVS